MLDILATQENSFNQSYQFIINGQLQSAGLSIAQLVATRLPLLNISSPTAFYGGAPGTQTISVVDALTVNVKLNYADTTPVLGDISQLLAAALFNRAADGIYPDISDPFAARLDELDNIVVSLEDIDVTTSNIYTQQAVTNILLGNLVTLVNQTIPYLADIRSFLLDGMYVNIPTTKGLTGSFGNNIVVPLAPMLFEALYFSSINNINGANTLGFLEYLPVARLLGMPFADPVISQFSASCTTASSAVAPDYPGGNLYGSPILNDVGGQIYSYPGGGSLLPITRIPYEPIQRCVNQTFSTADPDQRLVQLAPISMKLAQKNFVVT
jgi:hypothetical protein